MTDETTGEVIAPTTVQISDALNKPFPQCAIKQNEKGLDYIGGETAILRLNKATGNNWNLRIVLQEWRELPVSRKKIGRNSQGEDEYEVTIKLCHIVTVEITIPGLGTRAGMGVQEVQAGGGADVMCKGALTDALKVAAKQFGVALHLYGPDREAENDRREAMGQKASQPSQSSRTAPQAQSGRQNAPKEFEGLPDEQIRDIHTLRNELARVFKSKKQATDFRGSQGLENERDLTPNIFTCIMADLAKMPGWAEEKPKGINFADIRQAEIDMHEGEMPHNEAMPGTMQSDIGDESYEVDPFGEMAGTTAEQQATWALESVK